MTRLLLVLPIVLAACTAPSGPRHFMVQNDEPSMTKPAELHVIRVDDSCMFGCDK